MKQLQELLKIAKLEKSYQTHQRLAQESKLVEWHEADMLANPDQPLTEEERRIFGDIIPD